MQTTAAIVRNAGEIADSTRLGQSDDQIGISGKGGKQKKKVSPEFNVNEDLTINGNIIFTPPSPHFTRDITMQNNNGGLRFFGAPTLTNSPAAAAIQFWGNNSPFPGQLYLDSGAHDSGAVIIRTTGTGGTITERMRVTASGNVGIGTGVLTSKVEIAAQDGLAITGFQPFMTLRDTNTGGLRSILAGGNGDFGFYPNSFIGGGPAVLIKNVTGNVGIGVSNPTARLQVDAGNTAGIQANSQGNAIVGYSSTTGFAAIYGENTSGSSGFGVYGKGAVGVRGEGGAGSSQGVYGSGFYGVFGSTSNVNGAGVYGESTVGSAGFFAGDVTITGSLYGVQDGFFDGTVYAEEFISRNGFFDGTVHAGDFIERSDRNVKANFANVDTRDILQRLAAIPIQTWNFKSQPESVRHLGPMAQDFRAAFNLGYDDKHIGTIDADGVALAAIQALYQLVQEKDKQIEHLQARVARLERTAKKRSIGPRPASR